MEKIHFLVLKYLGYPTGAFSNFSIEICGADVSLYIKYK